MSDTTLGGFIDRVRGPVPASPAVTERLVIAERPVLVRFGSLPLAELLARSMRHLRQPFPGPADLVIDCWTGEAGMEADAPGGWGDGGLSYLERESIHLTWEPPGGPLVIYDRDRRHAWMRFGPLDSIMNWEVATPFRKIMHWWAADRSLQLIHAAAVGDARGGVLLVGRSGSGKSTTALACLAAGLGYAGDDYCLVRPGTPPRVHGLYLSGKSHARTADLLPGLRERLLSAQRIDEGKSIVFADEIAPSSVALGFPLVAVVVPRITGGDRSRLEPISAAESLRALAPSTVLQMPGKRAAGLARLADLVRSVPSWRLFLGKDPGTAVDVLADLLGGQSGLRGRVPSC